MGLFEDRFVYTYPLQPLVYVRYIDDIFIIWQHSREELDKFITQLNSCVNNIKFSHEISDESISFLDIKVIKIQDHLKTTLYSKPTDAHDYILYNSAHPQRCKDSIPYSQFLRVRRICSDIDDFDYNVIKLATYFLRKKYPLELLQNAALLARRKDRLSLLQDKPPVNDDRNKVFLITTYNPNDSTLKDLAFKNWNILGTSSTTTHVFEKRLMLGYRRPKNIRDTLVRAEIQPLPTDSLIENRPKAPNTQGANTPVPLATTSDSNKPKQTTLDGFVTRTTPHTGTPPTTSSSNRRQGTAPNERGFKFCNNPTCKICKLLNKTGYIISHHTKDRHETMHNISCRSSNLIYCISCKICGKQYVGQTLRRLRDRISEHLRDIDKGDKTKPLGLHFTTHDSSSIEVHVLEFIKKAPRGPQTLTIRNRVEKRWIHLLRTPIPLGLNLED